MKKRIKLSAEDKIYYTISGFFIWLLLMIIIFPLVHIVAASFSSGRAVALGKVFLWPVNPSLEGYKLVFTYRSVLTGYRNTIIYTALGTSLNIIMTMFAAFPLSRRNFQGRKFFMTLYIIQMFFSGGLIPSYILIVQLRLINSMWAIILPGMVGTFNLIITRTFLQSTIPDELMEASKMDGCTDFRFFFAILLPLSKAIIAVIGLFYAVGYWNAWFTAMIYLRDPSKHPLQLVLRQILFLTQFDSTQVINPEDLGELTYLREIMRYSLIIVSSVPIIMIYPFIQKYFIKGVMIGSLKG